MNYEKMYKDALERAKNGKPIDKIFPELKESEDERIRKELLLDIPKVFPHDKAFKYIAWLEKKNEQTPAEWNEEDENRLNNLYDYLEGHLNLSEKAKQDGAIWLKSLKDRVLPQPKQEWSEEDENCLYMAIECVKTCGYPNIANWLKSLRPQSKQDHFE